MKTTIILLFGSSCFYASAQECGNCKITPTVALYDLEIQVPEPEQKGEETKGWLEWLQLFWLARHANDYLYQNNKDCIRFVVGPDQDADKDGRQETRKVGAAYTHLPHKSYNKGYLTTGYVRKSGSDYIMHMELQSACNRKTIATAEAPFSLATILDNSKDLGQQAAKQLMPLVELIKNFELKERAENKQFAVGGLGRELIKITPAKKELTTGQQTEITVILLDCDGVPLAGREIVFTTGNLGETKLPGTIGGTVMPAKLVTDAQGKAKAIFKMTAAAGKPAIINAHTLTSTPDNCRDAFIGSTKIDLLPAYKVIVTYQKTYTSGFRMKSEDAIMSITLADEQAQSEVFASASFYYYGKAGDKGVHISGEKPSSQLVFTDLRGYSSFQRFIKSPEMEVKPLASGHKEGKDSVETIFTNKLLSPDIDFSFDGGELNDFDIDFMFADDSNGKTPDYGGALVIRGDKDAIFNKRKITDPNSIYKTEYTILYIKKTFETNSYGNLNENIFQGVVILTTF